MIDHRGVQYEVFDTVNCMITSENFGAPAVVTVVVCSVTHHRCKICSQQVNTAKDVIKKSLYMAPYCDVHDCIEFDYGCPTVEVSVCLYRFEHELFHKVCYQKLVRQRLSPNIRRTLPSLLSPNIRRRSTSILSPQFHNPSPSLGKNPPH